ncbi:hypothetical protein JCM11641_005267 [Rhodosporidiobolus odoratus]
MSFTTLGFNPDGTLSSEPSFPWLTFSSSDFLTRDGDYDDSRTPSRDPFDDGHTHNDASPSHHSSLNLRLLAILLPTLALFFTLFLILFLFLKIRGVKKRVEREKRDRELKELERRERDLMLLQNLEREMERGEGWRYPPVPAPTYKYEDWLGHRHHGHRRHRHYCDEEEEPKYQRRRAICEGRKGCQCGCGR